VGKRAGFGRNALHEMGGLTTIVSGRPDKEEGQNFISKKKRRRNIYLKFGEKLREAADDQSFQPKLGKKKPGKDSEGRI